MKVREIVTEWLKAHGCDGLTYDNIGEPCGCAVGDDFMPCEMDSVAECEAGHKVPCVAEECGAGGGCQYHIAPGPKPIKEVES